MVLMMKLKHVDELSGGRKRFRRRYPKAVIATLGEELFQVPMKAREGADLVVEHEAVMREYEKIVTKARRRAAGQGQLSPLEHWREAVKEAEAMVASLRGNLSEDERREVLADDLRHRGANSMLYKAVVMPEAEAPAVTMLDAKELYRRERMSGAVGRNQKNRLDRVCRRIETTLGPLGKLPLVELKREHARKLRDAMLTTTKKGSVQETLSQGTLRRELGMIGSMVSLAIREYDLEGIAKNPFDKLDMPKGDSAPENEWDRRDPLPKEVILGMRQRVRSGRIRESTLGLIWRLLEGTGCRGAEVVGLRVEDVSLSGPYPHIRVRWHEERRVKTKVSIRSVPLVGDALAAAEEAVKLAEGEHMLFPRYAHDGGPDAVSAALMKHLRELTTNRRHVVYSLRHNMKDLLVMAGVPERDEHRILGHALGGVGNRVYGGDEAKLKAATEAMRKAIALAP